MSQFFEFLLFSTAPRHHFHEGWQPPVDVHRCRHGWLLKFELAGINQKDIQVQVHGRQLTVSGIRRDWRIDDLQEMHRLEIAYSRFERSIEFPDSIDQAIVSTAYRDGMFLVYLETTESTPSGSDDESPMSRITKC